MLSGLPYALIYVEPDEMAFRGMVVIWIENSYRVYCSQTSRIPYSHPDPDFNIVRKHNFMNHIPFWLKMTFLTYALCFSFSFLPTSVFKVYSSSAASVFHSVVIIPLTEDLACLLCCFSIHSSHRPVCIRSLCIRASASDTSVESRLTRFAMVNSHHRYLAEFTGHIVDVLVCTLNLCLLWTWLLRIRLCMKHVWFQRFWSICFKLNL